MNINISLIGQMITFGILIWVTVKYVWPPLIGAVDKRNKEISSGLAAAEQGKQALADAKDRQEEILNAGRERSSRYIAEGKQTRDEIVRKAAEEAIEERDRIVAEGIKSIEQDRQAMVRELRESYAELVVAGAGRILRREVDAQAHKDIVDDMVAKI